MDISIESSYLEHRFQDLLRRADRGSAQAQWLAAICLRNGDGTAKDPAAALRYLTAAAEHGHAKAELELANWYRDGICTHRSIPDALKWYERAADHGLGEAFACVGRLYEEGAPGIPRAHGYAMQLYEQAASAGYPQALVPCGLLHLAKFDPRAAADCFSRARDKGVAEAARRLGDMYLLCISIGRAPDHANGLSGEKKNAFSNFFRFARM